MDHLVRAVIIEITEEPEDIYKSPFATDVIVYRDPTQRLVIRQFGTNTAEVCLTRLEIEKLASIAATNFDGKKPGEA